jgi:tetratricopeptide (TPR) repeat protein
MPDKADEVRRTGKAAAERERRGAAGGAGDGLLPAPGAIADPLERARAAEAAFRAALAAAGDSPADRARIQDLARDAADELLSAGDIRRAADVYRDGGLDDEAIHLYVNVLGSPGEAAPLLAAHGNHERAAELYEIAGQKERAAGAWVQVARTSPQPEQFVDRIERLSADTAVRFLEDLVGGAAPTKATAELHYRLGGALQKKGDTDRARQVLLALHGAVGSYRDVVARLETLRVAPPPPAASPPAPSAAPAPVPGYSASAPVPGPLSREELTGIAMEAARAAVAQARKGDVLAALGKPLEVATSQAGTSVHAAAVVHVVGLERQSVSLDLAYDSAVKVARAGPSIGQLRKFLGDRPCDLGNIEVYYRIGLAHLGAGQWGEALECFDAVEEASPGYRDADRRAEQIRGWQKAVGPRLSGIGARSAAPGAESGRYEIEGELGRGGMAVVYRAKDTVLGRDVALKFMSEEWGSKQEMRDLFQREARSVAALNHPNIVTVHDFGVLEGRLFICMEFVEGKAVEQMVGEAGRLPVVEALRIVKQVLDALAYAHEHAIIHRDVKPSNMMRTRTGLVKLMDFGLAKSIAGGAKASLVAGTPQYMPIEQLRGTEVDQRADLFAVGASLYEMLTGALPFEGVDRGAPAKSLRTHLPNLPRFLDDAVCRALEHDPARRFQSAAELRAPIERILEGVDRLSVMGADSGPSPVRGDQPATAPTVRAKP